MAGAASAQARAAPADDRSAAGGAAASQGAALVGQARHAAASYQCKFYAYVYFKVDHTRSRMRRYTMRRRRNTDGLQSRRASMLHPCVSPFVFIQILAALTDA